MILRVWGTADEHEIVFKLNNDGLWEVSVPTDLSDGQYVVELYAQDDYGFTIFYTGMLYIFDGKATLIMDADDIEIGIHADDIEIAFCESIDFEVIEDDLCLEYTGSEIVGEWCEM